MNGARLRKNCIAGERLAAPIGAKSGAQPLQSSVSFSGFLIVPGSESMNMSYHALNGSFVMAGTPAEELLYRQLVPGNSPVVLVFKLFLH